MTELTEDNVNTLIQEPLLADRNNEDSSRSTNIINLDIEEEEEMFLSGISDVPYKTYAKFFFYFSRWPLAVFILNIILFYVEDAYGWYMWNLNFEVPDGEKGDSFDVVVAAVLILDTIFLLLAAKAIDRDTELLENERDIIYHSDQEEQRNSEINQGDNTMDWNNYQHIYGRVARKIDVWLLSACQTHRTNAEPPPRRITFLSHLCWINWAFFFAGSYSHTLELTKNYFFPEAANMSKVIPFASISGYENISEIPEDLIPWTRSGLYRDRHWDNVRNWTFPIRDIYDDVHPLAIMNDRMFVEDLMGDKRPGLHEIVTINNTFIMRYHNDTLFPNLFIPVESSVDRDDPSRASRYCFLSGSTYNNVHCTMENNSKELDLKNATLKWEFLDRFDGSRVRVASYQNLLFIMKDVYLHKEVIKVDTRTMETSEILSGNFKRKRSPRITIEEKSNFWFFNAICSLVIASYYLISKRGIISGIFCLTSAVAFILDFFFLSNDPLLISIGMVFFHLAIHTSGRWRDSPLPVWVDKNVLIWALYGWNFAFLIGSLEMPDNLGMLSLILSSLILGHPVLHVLGYVFLVFACIIGVLDPEYTVVCIFISVGITCIVLGNFFSKHKLAIYTRSRYIMRCLLRWYVMKFDGSSSRSTANFRYE